MKRMTLALLGLLSATFAQADDVSGKDRILCAINKVMVCTEYGECLEVFPSDIGVPSFIIVDSRKKLMSTTESSLENRSTEIQNLSRENGRLFLQGIENNRAYTILVEEESGFLTGAVSRGGLTVSAFGSCTDATH